MRFNTWRITALAALGYALVSIVFTWPLVLHLGSSLPGSPTGDTGVYVWNLWVFHHEVSRGHFPFFTSTIFSLDSTANLSLHNYTVFADIIATPLLPVLGVVHTFNLLNLSFFVLNAWAMFLLVHHVTRRRSVAWLAGLLFGFSPTLVARSMEHASLLAAAPLPLFVYCLFRMGETGRRRWAIAGGATLAWATLCDPYYGVYCLVLAAWHLATRMVRVDAGPWLAWPRRASARLLEAAVAVLLSLTAAILITGGSTLRISTWVIGLQTTYTPMLLLTVAGAARLLLSIRPRVTLKPRAEWVRLLGLAPFGAGAGALILSPLLYAFALRVLDGRYVAPTLYWRSSTPGTDLAAFFVPNPNNPWLAGWGRSLALQDGGFAEHVASLTVVALAVIAIAAVRGWSRTPRYWTGLTLLAASVTLGPFVRLAGVETHIPAPWAFLRFAPIVGAARAPSRFAVLVVLAVSVVFGFALKGLLDRCPNRRRLALAAVSAALVLELLPAPRPLHSAAIPRIYERIASDPRSIRIMELPFGVRDGLSSYGDYRASTQYYQTYHQKPIISGYLSRLSAKRLGEIRRRPVLRALIALSEGGTIPAEEVERLVPRGEALVDRGRLAYVVVDRSRASQALVDFAEKVLGLEKIDQSGDRELYRTRYGSESFAGLVLEPYPDR